MKKQLVLAAVLLGLAPTPGRAQSILWWVDFNVGTSALPGALALGPWTATSASDQADFVAKVALGGWDLVILGEQDNSLASARTAVGSWVAGGGRSMYMTWRNESLLADFEASRTGINVYSVTGAGPLFAGISSPINLLNLDWGVDNQRYTTLGGSTCLASSGGDCAAVLGSSGRTLLLGPLSDTYADQAQGERFIANGIDVLLGPSTAVPEPTSIALLATGLVGIGLVRRRRSAGQ